MPLRFHRSGCAVPLIATHLLAFGLMPTGMWVIGQRATQLKRWGAKDPFVAQLGLGFLMVRASLLLPSNGVWGRPAVDKLCRLGAACCRKYHAGVPIVGRQNVLRAKCAAETTPTYLDGR